MVLQTAELSPIDAKRLAGNIDMLGGGQQRRAYRCCYVQELLLYRFKCALAELCTRERDRRFVGLIPQLVIIVCITSTGS